jgi:phospholipase C
MGTKGRWLASALGACAIAAAHGAPSARAEIATYGRTATPIKHVVVIFQENVSFDHYFATYPHADNRDGEPTFWAASNTPSVNGLTGGLLSANPNGFNPFRLDLSQAATCDQDHDYTAEQQAFDAGLMDKFPQFAGVGGRLPGLWLWQEFGHGLLRRKHSHGTMELRAAFRDER